MGSWAGLGGYLGLDTEILSVGSNTAVRDF